MQHNLDNTKLAGLKGRFCSAMSKHSNRNKEMIDTLWNGIVSGHQYRSYHNLHRAYEDLNLASKSLLNVSDYLLVAMFLRYLKFHASTSDNMAEAASYADFTLTQAFGWKQFDSDEVLKLIRAGSRLIKPNESDDFQIRLVHDLKTARLAKQTHEFAKDRQALREEFTIFPDEKFYRLEQSVLIHYRSAPKLFSLKFFNDLESQARDNIEKRLTFLGTRIGIMDSAIRGSY